MRGDEFYEEMTPQSAVKVELVTKYFGAWARIMDRRMRTSSIGYADLYSGPGAYRNGIPSTPIRILQFGIKHETIRHKLRTFFNDGNAAHSQALSERIGNLEGVETLRFRPQVGNEIVDRGILKRLQAFADTPTLHFVDPWGYKGISADLLRHTVQGKGSECILFFNFNRINSAIANPVVQHHMRELFGGEDYESLLNEILTLDNSKAREERIVQALTDLLASAGAEHHFFFRFEQVKKERTSHYIVFASKHPLGAQIMKDIMARESLGPDGIPLYEWKPDRTGQLSLDLGLKRLEVDHELGQLMLQYFGQREATVKEVFNSLSVGTRYTLADFQRVINSLEESGKVVIDKPRESRMVAGKLTLGENRRVRFLE